MDVRWERATKNLDADFTSWIYEQGKGKKQTDTGARGITISPVTLPKTEQDEKFMRSIKRTS